MMAEAIVSEPIAIVYASDNIKNNVAFRRLALIHDAETRCFYILNQKMKAHLSLHTTNDASVHTPTLFALQPQCSDDRERMMIDTNNDMDLSL